jgi:hypothetical protein
MKLYCKDIRELNCEKRSISRCYIFNTNITYFQTKVREF